MQKKYTQDTRSIILLLQVLASFCDGQHEGMQNYMRRQLDNVRSFNIVSDTCHFFATIYTHLNESNLDLALQLCSTLNEMSAVSLKRKLLAIIFKIR